MCPTCGNKIEAGLSVFEYPIGDVESVVMGTIHDEAEGMHTKVEKPKVEVFDL
ncbi:MAG: hypothetical protein PHW47_13385 [Lachnospira sp.]|nr:hypothetical protein [Lachnospira sp.]